MKKFLALSCWLFVFSFPLLAQETFTLTTYYPAPFGVYTELRSRRMAIGDTYFQQSLHPWSTTPSPAGNEIDQNADLVVEGNVGIGTLTPATPLDVAGGIHIHNSGLTAPRYRGLLYTGKSDEYPTYEEEFVMTIHDNQPNVGGDNKSSITIAPSASGATGPQGRVEVVAQKIYLAPPVSGGTGNVAIGKPHDQEIYAKLDVDGGVKIANDTRNCGGVNGAHAGTIRYNGGNMQYCHASNTWVPMGGGTLECNIVKKVCSNADHGTCVVACSSGYILTGGGIRTWHGSNVDDNRPVDPTIDSGYSWYNPATAANSWVVYDNDQNTNFHEPFYAYARCCRIQ